MDYPEIIPSKSVFKYYCHLIVTRHKTSQETPQIRHFLAHVHYSNSSHRRLIAVILIAFSLLFIAIFAIFSVMILTGIKIVLKLHSHQHDEIYSSISGILINSCSFFCNTALSGNCSLYSATIIGDRFLLIAYSTTSSSLEAQRIIPTLGFSFSFFF